MTFVKIQSLTKTYTNTPHPAIENLNLDIPSGKLVALLGPSGCGKTTTLKMITGQERPSSGDITFDGKSVIGIPTEKRDAVMVFQNYLLFPYMTVGENIGFGLKMRKIPKTEIQKKVDQMLELVKLPNIAKRYPKQLSGGQQQRVALARALIIEPKVLLLDEPLSNLDAHLRDEMRELILSIQRGVGVTTIFVTHDQEEAVLLADHIALLNKGQLIQFDSPNVLFRNPSTEWAARFLGGVNFVNGVRQGDQLTTPFGKLKYAPPNREQSPEGDVIMTIRPEQILIGRETEENSIEGTLVSKLFVGTYHRCKVMIQDNLFEVYDYSGVVTDIGEGQSLILHFPSDKLWAVPQA